MIAYVTQKQGPSFLPGQILPFHSTSLYKPLDETFKKPTGKNFKNT